MLPARATAMALVTALAALVARGSDGARQGARSASAVSARSASDADVSAARATAHVPAIAFAAVSANEVIALGAAGEADVERAAPATADTVFDAASIGKLVVATTVMQLVDEGRASLDADVSTYAGFPVHHRGRAVSLRMLLTHTSAIRDHDLVEGSDVPLGRFLLDYLVDRGAEAFHDGAPGDAYAYSNVGVALAAYVVERVRGRGFAEVARTRVFDPLGMNRTGWSARGVDAAHLATPYATPDATRAPRRLPPAAHAVWPASDLYTSAHDLARFARAILREGELDGVRIVSREAARAMLEPQGSADQGLGFQLRVLGGRETAGHEGEDQGATAALFLDPRARTGAVVLANGDAFASGDAARARAIQALLVDLLERAQGR